MFEQDISPFEIEAALQEGEIILEDTSRRPFPVSVILWRSASRAIHVVVAHNPDTLGCIIVTVYRPDLERWDPEFKSRHRR
jgi:hypothetical protein